MSVGRQIGKFGSKELCWEAVGPAREAFIKICPRIKEYLETGVETVSSWVTWSMYMVGKAPEVASPTILFCCEVSAHRKLVRNVIKESGILDLHPGIKTGHASRPPDFNQLVRMAEVGSQLAPNFIIEGRAPSRVNACGMSLVIKSDTAGCDHDRNATVGGVIQLGEQFFYFTADHAFHTINEEESDDSFSETDCDSEFSIDEDSTSDDAEEEMRRDSVEIGKLTIQDGIGSGSTPRRSELPKIDPNPRDKVEQQGPRMNLEAFRLLPVSISSGTDPVTNLDYGLIEVSNPDHKVPNSVLYSGKRLDIQNIVSDGPKDVTILGVTSRGILIGRLSGTPMYTSLPTTNTYQEVYSSFFDSPLETGDCGSWVIDANTGHLFGHVVAGSPATGAAMIIPAYLTFNDMEDRTQIRPKLPSNSAQSAPTHVESKLYSVADEKDDPQAASPSEGDMAWTKEIAAQFVKIVQQKLKQNIRRGILASRDIVEASSTECPTLPSYEQTTNENMLRDRFKRRFPLIPEPPSETDSKAQRFYSLLMALSNTPFKYEDDKLLSLALETMPLEEIYRKAAEKEASYGKNAHVAGGEKAPRWDFLDCAVISMMDWFKNKFFTWVNNPPCPVCHSATIAQGVAGATEEEKLFGAARVELYRCSNEECNAIERFPRYIDPLILIQTRRGRGGEWVNCFGMFCRALGAKVRWVWTAADHVFVEFYSKRQRRWVHADPCENIFDQPRLYTEGKLKNLHTLGPTDIHLAGWGKTMTYAIAFSIYGATDVTRRYVRGAAIFKDNPRTRCSEEALVYMLWQITAARRSSMSDVDLRQLQQEDAREQQELNGYMVSSLTHEFATKWRLASPEPGEAKVRKAEELAEREYSQAREA